MESALVDVGAYASTLVHCLRQWDPLDDAQSQDAQAKQDFIDALTEISALPADALDMEARRLIVDAADARHLTHLVRALSHRDVLLKCKVANAVGSLCTSRVAGQRLLDLHGDALLASLSRMATSKNTWAQADAFFVFGWVVVIGEDAVVHEQLARFVATAVKLLARNLSKPVEKLDEQDANLRIYCLVFLLNFSQRDVGALEPELSRLLETLQSMVARLLAATTSLFAAPDQETEHARDKMAEHMEILRLTVTLLHAVVEEVATAPATVLALKMLPDLLKLEQTLQSAELIAKLRELEAGDRGEELEDSQESAQELDDLRERMRCIKETVLACR